MTPLQIIEEFEKGCGNTLASGKPEECPECVRAMLVALRKALTVRLTESRALHLQTIGRTPEEHAKMALEHIQRLGPIEGCYCQKTCGAPIIMGRQMPCIRNPAYPLVKP